MHSFSSMSAAAQAAYANVLSAAVHSDINRGVTDLPGGFSQKTVRGKLYWYYQVKTDGVLRQIYVGPDSSPEVRGLVDRHRSRDETLERASHLRRLCQSALALGCAQLIPSHAKVVRRLSDHGFFRAGGILIGTHAFLAYQNMLGAVWGTGTMTLDIDFAHPRGGPEFAKVDTHKAIDSLSMGFIPNASNTTYTKKDEPDFELDFLTSRGRDTDQPLRVADLNLCLQPLKFMEYSMEDVQLSAVLTGDGPVVVNLPAPERFALHKLIVAGERRAEQSTKAAKDIEQANCLIEFLGDSRPGSLADAYADLVSRGKGWKSRFDEGVAILRSRHPETDLSFIEEQSPPRERG